MRAADIPRWTPEEYRHRPGDFDPALGDQICERVANGETLTEICKDRDYPFPATFLRWCRTDPTLGKAWREAQLDRLDVMNEECVVLANGQDASVAANQMKSRHWMSERLNPKKYAQRTAVSVGLAPGGDEEAGVDYGSEVRRKLEQMAVAVRVEDKRVDIEGERVG